MVYENDPSAVRDAKEEKDNAEREIAIANLEKQIDLLEDQKELINDEIEALEKQREALEKSREATEKYYDDLIAQTEKYWDSIIEGLEKQKSKWEELAEIKEIANAYALIQEAGESLGYSVEDILNDVPGAFEAFRDAYIRILQEANSENSHFLDGLAHATGTAKDSVNSALGEIAGKASEVNQALEPLGEVSNKLGDTADSLSGIASNSGTAASNVGSLSGSLTEAGNSAENVSKVDSSIQSIAGAQLDSTVSAFQNLAGALKDCAEALGIGDGEISAFESAIDALSKVDLGNDTDGAIGAFTKLKSAVDGVVQAINGGGGSSGGTDPTESASQSMSADAESGTGSGLVKAIEDTKQAAIDNIGADASDEGDTAIGKFNALKDAITNEKTGLIATLGNADSEADDGTLVGALKQLPISGDEVMNGENGLISLFNALLSKINECVDAMNTLLEKAEKADGLGALDQDKTGNVHINGHQDGNVHGNAYGSGKLGIKKSENALVGELGQELVYNPETGTYRTVGDHGPEITHLNKGDLIFNAEQTKAIIKHGKHGGNSYAEGSGLMPLSDAEMNMFKTMGDALVGIKADTSQMLEPVRTIAQNISKVTTNNISPTINISGTSFNVSGVTGEAVAAQIRDTFTGLVASAYQRAMT